MGIVVTLVTVEFARPATSWPAAGADRRDAANQRLQRQAVVDVGGADRDRDGRTGPLGDEVDLRPVLAAIDKFGFVSSAFDGPHAHRVNRAPRPDQLSSGAELVQQDPVQLGPHPRGAPLGEAAVQRLPGGAETGGNCRHAHPVVAT